LSGWQEVGLHLASRPPEIARRQGGADRPRIHGRLGTCVECEPKASRRTSGVAPSFPRSAARAFATASSVTSESETCASTPGAHFRIPDAKTEAGVREVQVSSDLQEELVSHIARLRRARLSTDPDDNLFPNLRSRRVTRQRVNEILREAAELASASLTTLGFAALATPLRTVCVGPTSQSRCWRTGSTFSG
jgi:hypothetical protein